MDKKFWNKFVLENNGSFLQSYEWGEFQASVGRRGFRFSGDGWQAQFIENKLPGVNKFYWHGPRAPLLEAQNSNVKTQNLKDIVKKIGEAAGKNIIFFRLGPDWPMADRESLIASGFKQLPYDIEPSQTQILDITKIEEELLAQMHEKWRYNIRLAERKGVRVKLLTSDIDNFDIDNFEYYLDEFYRLVSEGTAERKGIRHYSKEYYKKQLGITSSQPSPSKGEGEILPNPPFPKGGDHSLYKREVRGDFKSGLFVAEYEGRVIAANIVVIFGNRATYLHGATSSEHREVMAPHLLQWEQIKYAKSQGCAEYDFWGIVNERTLDRRGKSWEGFTRFKRGFGGREINYVGYWDYPLDKTWYSLYRLVQKFRR